MAQFTADVGGSSFPDPNILFNSASGITGQTIRQNELLNQGRQLDLSNANVEQVSRLSAGLLNEQDPAKRAELYSRGVGYLQSQGFAMHAPPTLPDEATLRFLATQGTPSEKQFEYGAGRTAAQGALGALGIGGTGIATPTGTTATAGAPAAPGGPIEPSAQARATAVRDGLIKRGMDADTATAFAANALHESAANPNTGPGDGGVSQGLFMWNGPRNTEYQRIYGHTPQGAPLDEQLDFVMHELNGPESLARDRINQAQGVDGKAAQVSEAYLRPKDTEPEMQRRSATALQLQRQLGGGTQTVTAPAGGGGTPGRVQVASVTPTTATDGTTAPPGSTAAPDAVWDLPGAPAPDQPTAPVAPAAAPPAATPAAAQPAPQVPLEPMLQLMPSGLTAQQEAAAKVAFAQPMTPAAAAALTAHYQTLAANNIATNHTAAQTNFERTRQAQSDVRQAQNDALAQQEKAKADAIAAENLRLSQLTSEREQKKAEQGSTQADRDAYTLRTAEPSSQQYADAWQRKKWTVAPNGNVIENDVSMYPAPARSVQRPSFVPAPTPQGLDEVRKADTDAKVITSAIDHYTDVYKATGGGGWDAYFANPTDPKTQQLLGAFDRMKTVLRSPVYYNTGVLQPAEIQLMGQDLVSPQSLRGVFASPQALATRLGEIKLAILTRQDAELRSIGKDGVIVRDKADFAKVPEGGRYYDEEGHLRVK